MATSRLNTLVVAVIASMFVLGACGSSSDDTVQNSDDGTAPEVITEAVSDDPTEALPAASTDPEAPDVEPTIDPVSTEAPPVDEPDGLSELDGLDVSTCAAVSLREWYVDVALDDPDGGLNMRIAPGVDNDIVAVFPRSSALVSTGPCATLGTFDWWKVTNLEGTLTGWVSSRFLSDLLVFNPGLGKAIDDLDNAGLQATTLDELAALIAESYGFDEDATITMTSDDPAIDAQGGTATYEMTGLKDDASNGYIVDIQFVFDKDAESGDIESVTATRVTNYSLCSRGVTDDGLCT